MAEAQNGTCACWCGCTASLEASGAIGEHTVQVWLGNEDKPDRLLCVPCAKIKTARDARERARCKRLAKGGKTRRGPKIQSRGFDKTLTRGLDGKVRERK